MKKVSFNLSLNLLIFSVFASCGHVIDPVSKSETIISPSARPPTSGDYSLDTTFASVGYVVSDGIAGGGSFYDAGVDLALDSQDRVVVVGHVAHGASSEWDGDVGVWRYNTDGSLDTTFNSTGYYVYDSGSSDSGNAVAITSSGSIIVSGRTYPGGKNMSNIWKLDSDGSLDTSFSGDGIVGYQTNSNHTVSWGMILDSSEKILIFGETYHTNGTFDMFVMRLNTDGSLDTDFSGDGFDVQKDTAGSVNGSDTATDAAIDSNGNIFLAGRSENASGDYDLVVWKYDSTGALDTTFDLDGYAIYDAGISGDDEGRGITIDSSGRPIVTGFTSNGVDDDIIIIRFNTDGSLDTTFGDNGVATYTSGNGGDRGDNIKLDSSGRILLTGYVANGSNTDMVLMRYNITGEIDTSFGNTGIHTHDAASGSSGDDFGRGLFIANDTQDIFVTGRSQNGASDMDMAIWKYR